MATLDSRGPSELDALRAGMRKQFDSKSSLFDPLAAPQPPVPSPAAARANELKSAIRMAAIYAFAATAVGLFIAFAALRSTGQNLTLVVPLFFMLGGLGIASNKVHRLLCGRIATLETELRELRAALASSQPRPSVE